jgi:hypothetical protein
MKLEIHDFPGTRLITVKLSERDIFALYDRLPGDEIRLTRLFPDRVQLDVVAQSDEEHYGDYRKIQPLDHRKSWHALKE